MRTKNQQLPKIGAEQDDGICNVQPFWMQRNLDAKTQRFPVCRVRDIALGVIKSEKDKYGRTVFEMARGVGGRAVVG